MTSPLSSPSGRAFLRRRTGALAAVALLSLAALTACGEDDPAADPSPAAGTSATEAPTDEQSPTETSEPTESPSEPASEPAAEGTVVPVYWVGDTPQGPRLFREFRKVDGDPLTEAARLVAGGTPTDPDYRTLWPAVELSAQATDGVLLVQIPSDAFTERPDGMSERDARLALQQLVYTLQGVQQARVPVLVKRGGSDFRLFGLPTDREFSQAKPLDVLGLVSVTSPEQGATVTGDVLKAGGVASSFEATVPWEVRQGDTVVLEGFSTAEGWMDKLYPWEAEIDISSLAPGDYTFAAMTDDPSGGAEGAGPTEDTKDFTVR
ncbi:hypothetical protein DDE18_09190 [Nocardioides gansuensis]|uniref:GerMN domain-containing protein n=1 Tax=Nocardioides gansuensis TaxID=2138300 RepID=A0A2T8FCL3_9ACTN|nr:Gmad2 immunoglobulin-like domain-containing protein [Nocardioides gansuensis]PVG83448.1 hypothetical protein DDE18_09190 [Nocardioides gansuensis]